MASLDDLTAQCIRCGFCLESCPTFLESGSEVMSPRGRIHLAKLADQGEIAWSEPELAQALDSCVGCRACETACPSGVEYGHILESARRQLPKSKARQMMLGAMTGPLIRPGSLLGGRRIPAALSRAVSGRQAEAEMPRIKPSRWLPLTVEMPPVKGEVVVLDGCLMSRFFPSVQEATRRLLRRAGYQARMIPGCCGALHAHGGFAGEAERRGEALAAQIPPDLPVVMNSAGCGSHLKDLGWPRVADLTEFLLAEGFDMALRSSPGLSLSAAYHDACHLAHGQRVTTPPRTLLSAIPGLRLAELREADLCCGSGGAYNVFQPEMARRLLDRKWTNIEAAEPDAVVLGNPGCHAWIAQAARENHSPIRVMHTAEMLESAFSGLPT